MSDRSIPADPTFATIAAARAVAIATSRGLNQSVAVYRENGRYRVAVDPIFPSSPDFLVSPRRTVADDPTAARGYDEWSAGLDLGPESPEPPPAKAARVPKPFDREARMARGRELALARHILPVGAGDYLVPASDPTAAPYLVRLTPFGIGSCDCPDARYRATPRNENCAHVYACFFALEARTGERRAA